MMNLLKRTARFYAGWRGPIVVAALVIGYLGLSTDSWWSPVVALSSLLPLLLLYALTGMRVGSHEEAIDDQEKRHDAAETRLGHSENRDVAMENRLDAIDKKLKRLETVVATKPPPTPTFRRSETAPRPANSNVVTGQLMALYNIATGVSARPDDPLVTIVIPCYNDARFLQDAIRSVQEQTFANFTCIVVDDCSTDDSVAVAFRATGGDKRFHLVRHAINSGLSTSRNTGLRLAETPFICFLDSDDFFFVDNLEERVRHAIGYSDDPSIIGVYSGVEHCGEHVRFGEAGPSSPATHNQDFQDHLSANGSCPFNCHAPLLRTDVVRRFGGFDESMRHGAEDWQLWQRLMRHGYTFMATPSVLAVYRQKAQSMVRAMPGLHLAEAEKLLARVHQPIDPGEVVADVPYLYDEPIGMYHHKVQMAERVLQFIGMVWMTDDAAQIDSTFAQLDPMFWPVVERHLNVSALLDVGIRRGFALDRESYQHLDGKIYPIRDALMERLNANAEQAGVDAEARDAESPAATSAQHIDVLLVPENAAQAREMTRVASELDASLKVAVLEVNVVSGASGVTEVLDEAWPGERIGINPWVLGGTAPGVVVAQWPYGPTTSSVLDAAFKAGAETLELVSSDSIDRLDESPSTSCMRTVSLASDIVAAAAEANGGGELLGAGSISVAALAAIEEYPKLPADIGDMERFRNRHAGERCVIIGNGPSLNDLELGRLRNENTIGVNGIFYAESLDFPLTYYVVEDTSVMEENLEQIRSYKAGHKFFPTIYRDMYGVGDDPDEGVTFFTMNRGFYAKESPNFCTPRFSTDASQRLYCGQSVTIINLQLAYFMGFTEVYLIGMDFSYTIPDSAEREGDLITSTEDDPNHFHKDYFGKGKTWKDPKLERVLNNYQLAKVMFESDGRTIYNATAGGKLEMFPRADFHQVFKG